MQTLQQQHQRPPTRFARKVVDGSLTRVSIDWAKVLLYEPENVVHWIHYLHDHEDVSIGDLLQRFSRLIAGEEPGLPHRSRGWTVFMDTGVGVALVDVFCASGKFPPYDEPFIVRASNNHAVMLMFEKRWYPQSPTYAIFVLNAIVKCCQLVKVDNHPRAKQWNAALAERFDSFCDALWKNRHLVPKFPIGHKAEDAWLQGHSSGSFTIIAFFALMEMMDVYRIGMYVSSIPSPCESLRWR